MRIHSLLVGLLITSSFIGGCRAVPDSTRGFGDFNQDGIEDKIVLNQIGRETTVGIQYSGGGAPVHVTSMEYMKDVFYAESGDWNKDGLLDIGIIWDERGEERGMFSNRKIMYNTGIEGNIANFSSDESE